VALDGRRIRLVGLGVSNLMDSADGEAAQEEGDLPQMSLWEDD
jgi:hypothetical protein